MKKKSNNAFTLIELLIVIAIIAILILGSNFLNFNKVSNKQKLDTKIVKLVSQIEEIRNNALLGKGIGTDLFVPEKYKIDFSTSGSGIIKTQYLSGSYQDYNLFDKEINFSGTLDSISEIKCLKLDKSEINSFSGTTTGTGTIFIEGTNMSLSGSCDSTTKILELTLKRKADTKRIQINTLNGLIEIVK